MNNLKEELKNIKQDMKNPNSWFHLMVVILFILLVLKIFLEL